MFHFKEPVEQVFGSHYMWKTIKGIRKLVVVKDTFQYIPIIDVLQAMLNNDIIFEEVNLDFAIATLIMLVKI